MVKVLVSFGEGLLRQIDRVARSRRLSRSAYLSQLAQQDVARASGPGATPTARRALSRLDALFSAGPVEDSTQAIRAERDGR